MSDKDDAYSEEETEQRFRKIVRAALTTRPKPMKVAQASVSDAEDESYRTQIRLTFRLGGFQVFLRQRIDRLAAWLKSGAVREGRSFPEPIGGICMQPRRGSQKRS